LKIFRHTQLDTQYATVLKRSGANIAFISESLGHSDLRTTENYLSSFEQEERAKNASKLTNFNTWNNGKQVKKPDYTKVIAIADLS